MVLQHAIQAGRIGRIRKMFDTAMIYSRKYDHYKFPGGGTEKGETPVEALIRETMEDRNRSAACDAKRLKP